MTNRPKHRLQQYRVTDPGIEGKGVTEEAWEQQFNSMGFDLPEEMKELLHACFYSGIKLTCRLLQDRSAAYPGMTESHVLDSIMADAEQARNAANVRLRDTEKSEDTTT
jgi:hypothetical protein